MTTNVTIRPFEPADREPFLDLYETIYGVRKPEEWFSWKYGSNPTVDHIPIMVATVDDTLVGVRPLFVLPLRDGDRSGLGFQQSDAMVAPDYRRRGIFSTLVEATVDRYEDEAAVFFTFPNNASRPAYEKLGWTTIGSIPEGYRLQRPGRILAQFSGCPEFLATVLDRIGGLMVSLPGVGLPGPGGIVTERHPEPPLSLLADLANCEEPAGVHLDVDRSIIEWRFRNPDWRYETLVASLDGQPIAAVVVSRGTQNGVGIARVADVIPRSGDTQWRASVERLIRDVTSLHRDSDMIQVPLFSVPSSVGRQLGYVPDDAPLLGRLTTRTYLTVRSVTDGFPSERVESIDAWRPTFAEYDGA